MPSNIVRREELQREKGIDIPNLPVLAIRGHLCFRCLSKPAATEQLKTCAACKRAVYCSSECQKLDWDIQHRKECRSLRRINEYEVRHAPEGPRDWESYRRTLVELSHKLIDEDEDNQTQLVAMQVAHLLHVALSLLTELLRHQPYCSTCHRSRHQLRNIVVLRPCEDCHLVFKCDACPRSLRSHSQAQCSKYREYADTEVMALEHFERFETRSFDCMTRGLKSDYTSLTSLGGWKDYFTIIQARKRAEFLLKEDLIPSDDIADIDDMSLHRPMKEGALMFRMATEDNTIPMTILQALEDTVHNLTGREGLDIHIVGSSGHEFSQMALFEELLHQLPALKTVHLLLAGPSTPGDAERPGVPYCPSISLGCCPACTSRGRERTVSRYRGLYHDYGNSPDYAKPDMAVLFNSGRSQADVPGWRPTTEFLVESRTLTLCTTYTRNEALEENAELERMGARNLVPLEVNKWRSFTPIMEMLDWDVGEHSWYYGNYYRYVFQGRQ